MTTTTTTTTASPLATPAPRWGTEYREAFVAHLRHDAGVEGCAWCAASLLLPALHAVYFGDDADAFDLLWSMQDGYGDAGDMPEQGFDWSGVRDSDPATIGAMHAALVESGAIR